MVGEIDQHSIRVTDSLGETIFLRDLVPGVFREDLELTAGEIYTLDARLWGFGFGTSNRGFWQVTLPIPEPSTALLLGLGLGVLARSRQSRV